MACICIDLVPTEVCSWNCDYCQFPNITYPKHTTIEKIDKHYHYIKEIVEIIRKNNINVDFYIQGGEVGELPVSTLKHLLTTFNEKVTISTNGLFMIRKFHREPNIRKYIKQIFWHVSPDCSNPYLEDFNDNEINIIRGIVHSSQVVLKEFVKETNLDIKYAEVEKSLTGKSIVSEEIINKCRNYHSEVTIDLVNEELCLCIRNFNKITIPLNKDNLIRAFRFFPKDVFKMSAIEDSNCFSCCRLCVSRTKENIIKNKLDLKEIL